MFSCLVAAVVALTFAQQEPPASANQTIDPAALLNARLAPDMYPLTKQVQVATDMAKGTVARLAGVPALDGAVERRVRGDHGVADREERRSIG